MEAKYQAHRFEAIFLPLIELDGIAEDRETDIAWQIYQKIRSDGGSVAWISSPHIKAFIQRVRIDDGSLIIQGCFVNQEQRDSGTAISKTYHEWVAYLDKHAQAIEMELTAFVTQMTDGIIKENTRLEMMALYYDNRDY